MKNVLLFAMIVGISIFLACSNSTAPKDQFSYHYYVDLDQVRLDYADSVTIDYWVDGASAAKHLSKGPVSKTAVFDFLVDTGAKVSVKVRVYNGNVLVSTRIDQFDAGDVTVQV